MKFVKRGLTMNKRIKMQLVAAAVLSVVMANSAMAEEMAEQAKAFVPPPPGPYHSQVERPSAPTWGQQQRQNTPQPRWLGLQHQSIPTPPIWPQQRQNAPQPPVRPAVAQRAKHQRVNAWQPQKRTKAQPLPQ